MKAVFIAEKPSVAAEFAKALKLKTTRRDGYMESENAIVTWCVGHLVTMSYPECYDEKYKTGEIFTILTEAAFEFRFSLFRKGLEFSEQLC